MKAILTAIVAGLTIFFWSFIAHMFTPLAEAGIDYLPEAKRVAATLAGAIGAKDGIYMFPTGGLTRESSKAEKRAAMDKMIEEMRTSPAGLLIYRRPGTPFSFGKCLTVELMTNVVQAAFLVWLLLRARIASFGARVAFVMAAGLLAAITTNISYWNWYGFNGTYTAAYMTIEIVGFSLAGIVIALMTKRPA